MRSPKRIWVGLLLLAGLAVFYFLAPSSRNPGESAPPDASQAPDAPGTEARTSPAPSNSPSPRPSGPLSPEGSLARFKSLLAGSEAEARQCQAAIEQLRQEAHELEPDSALALLQRLRAVPVIPPSSVEAFQILQSGAQDSWALGADEGANPSFAGENDLPQMYKRIGNCSPEDRAWILRRISWALRRDRDDASKRQGIRLILDDLRQSGAAPGPVSSRLTQLDILISLARADMLSPGALDDALELNSEVSAIRRDFFAQFRALNAAKDYSKTVSLELDTASEISVRINSALDRISSTMK